MLRHIGWSVAMPFVIAHRGASGYRPEHTLAAYELGARQGADYIEPDLVSTADGHLVARHENEISSTTDIAARPEFAHRRTTKTIDGRERSGFFAEDFTLAELRTLRARERIPDLRPANAEHDGRHPIPTFQEIIDLAARLSEELGRPVGIYPETKHPSYHRSIGLPLEPGLVAALRRNGLDRPGAPVYVQSFEAGNLRALRAELRSRSSSSSARARTRSRPPRGCAASRNTRMRSARARSASCRGMPLASRRLRRASSRTLIARASRSTPTPSAARTRSSRPSCARATTRRP